MPTVTPASCPNASLIYNLHAPENIDELIGQYFSHPIPQPQLENIQFKVMRFLSNSSSHVLAQVNVGHKNTLMLGKFICDTKLAQTSPQTYGFYQIKSVVLLPNDKEHEYLSLNCSSVDGVFDGSVAGWRVNELTESLKEIETDNIKCWFGGPG